MITTFLRNLKHWLTYYSAMMIHPRPPPPPRKNSQPRPHPLRQRSATTSSSSAHLLAQSPPANGFTNGAGTNTRPRRSLSSDSYDMPGMKELTAGQRKEAAEKKGSRHADVIDTWDPTGLGSAMWHHAGPYDAAAPSRNANLPTNKAPMRAFNKEKAQPPAPPPQRGPTTISLSPPPIPAKDSPKAETPGGTGVATPGRRMGGGGLTGQYSTSMPTGGGYFPNFDEEPMDEAAMARMERQKERDTKRKALKAAWGVDTPEPFEDFGGSPNDGTLDISEDIYSPESTSAPLPARSPGLRLGLGPRSPPIKEDSTSPTSDSAPPLARGSGVVTATNVPPGGIKRTKSLMQKIKTMVRQKPGQEPGQGRGYDRGYEKGYEQGSQAWAQAYGQEHPMPGISQSYSGATGIGAGLGLGGVPSGGARPGLSAGQRSMSMSAGMSGSAGTGAGGHTGLPMPSPALTDSPVLEEDELEGGDLFVDGHEAYPGARGEKDRGLGMRRGERRTRSEDRTVGCVEPTIPGPTDDVVSPGSGILSAGEKDTQRRFFGRTAGRAPSPTKHSVPPPSSFANAEDAPANGQARSAAPPAIDTDAPSRELEGITLEDELPSAGSGTASGFVLVESPSSKERALRALQKEQQHSRAASHGGSRGASGGQPKRRVAGSTPPVAPVLDFEDYWQKEKTGGRGSPGVGAGGEVEEDGGMLRVASGTPGELKRKTSMVKKLRERIAK
ncbi:hypothetical protein IAT38_000446 [Cryptococcus sp. DSM 104549]